MDAWLSLERHVHGKLSAFERDTLEISQNDNEGKNPIEAKLKILEDEIKIIEDTNLKFKQENDNLRKKIASAGRKKYFKLLYILVYNLYATCPIVSCTWSSISFFPTRFLLSM